MEFKVGSLLNLISGEKSNKTSANHSTEERIVFQQKPKAASTASPNWSTSSKSRKKFSKGRKNTDQQNDYQSSRTQNSALKNSGDASMLSLKGTFKPGTLTKSWKKLQSRQDRRPEVAENKSQSVVGKSFKYTNFENASSTGVDTKGKSVDNIDGNHEKLERTIFVGNLPLTKKIDKVITKLFSPFGGIESFRLRSIPLKDIRVSKKVAAIKGEFHPERNGTNAYVVMKSKKAAEKALSLNGHIVDNHHLRVDQAKPVDEHDPRKAIFLGNVSFKAEEDDIWALFEQCGEIDHVRILRDQKTSVSKGAAYVNFKSADPVELALKMQGTAELHGRGLKIRRCLPGRKTNLHATSSRQPNPRNKDDAANGSVRTKEEKRFQKKMKRREKREAENLKNEALGQRSRPFKEPSTSTASTDETGNSYVGIKAENRKHKQKKKRLSIGEVQRKKVAKILANPRTEIMKHEEQSKVVDIDERLISSVQDDVPVGARSESVVAQDSNRKKKKFGVKNKIAKKAPKTILVNHKGEMKKKKLKKAA